MRALVVAEARSWLGTPYHHNARLKGAGVDCGQLLIGVYSGVGLVAPKEPQYPHDWHLHHGEELFLGWLQSFGARQVSTPKMGDIAVYRFGRCFSHGAIIVGDGTVIHSYLGQGVVVTGMDDHPLGSRSVQYWSIFED